MKTNTRTKPQDMAVAKRRARRTGADDTKPKPVLLRAIRDSAIDVLKACELEDTTVCVEFESALDAEAFVEIAAPVAKAPLTSIFSSRCLDGIGVWRRFLVAFSHEDHDGVLQALRQNAKECRDIAKAAAKG